MKRAGPLKRRAWLRRKTPCRHHNWKRLAKRRKEQFGPQADLCRALPCLVCGRRPSDAAHVRSRGAGGTGLGNIVPLCRFHHDEQGRLGIRTFERRHRVDLAEWAQEIANMVQHEGYGCALCGARVCDDETCARHLSGERLRDGRWVCSGDCFEAATRD